MARIYTATVYEIITALCRPESPQQERWRNYFIAVGAPRVICEEFIARERCETPVILTLLWHPAHCDCEHRNGRG